MNLTAGYTQALIDSSKGHGLLRNQCAYVLATTYHETGATMKPVIEANWLSEDWRKNHLRYYPWYGRGFVQLTWEANYIKAEKELGKPIHQNPALALDPVIAADIAVIGMKEGWFTGKKLSDFIDLQDSDFLHARKIINLMDKAETIEGYAKWYDSALKAVWTD